MQLTSRKFTQPSWLTGPCPEWCVAKTTHREEDLVDDRLHFSSWQRFILLTTADPVMIGRPPILQQRQLIVYVEQHISEDQPHVIVTDAHTDKNEHRFTSDEAIDLAAALLHGVSIVTDSKKVISGLNRTYTVKGD